MVHRLGLEALGVDVGGGKADAVHGDRVAEGDLRGQRGDDAQAGAVVADFDLDHGAEVLDQAGEHVTTP
jgi:hypothetical protein